MWMEAIIFKKGALHYLQPQYSVMFEEYTENIVFLYIWRDIRRIDVVSDRYIPWSSKRKAKEKREEEESDQGNFNG